MWVWNPSSEGVGQAVSLANNNYLTVLAYADKTYFDLAYTQVCMNLDLLGQQGILIIYSSFIWRKQQVKLNPKLKPTKHNYY